MGSWAVDSPYLEPCLTLIRSRTGVSDPGVAVSKLLELDSAIESGSEGDRLLPFLQRHRLDQLFLRAVREHGLEDMIPRDLHAALVQARRRGAATAMQRQEVVEVLHRTFVEAGVDYVVFKGSQIAEDLYGEAFLRPSADIDVLVAEKDRRRAAEALLAAGFEHHPQALGPDYQIAFLGQGTPIDLHWHVMQPERSRRDLTAWILQGRVESGGRSVPSPEATLVILLLNPAITDLASERWIQNLDLDRFLRAHPSLDWPEVLAVLDRSGLRTAAWTMLQPTLEHLASPLPEDFEAQLAPGFWRRHWLRAWLRRDPARLYHHWPLPVRLGFALFLQDRPGDILRYLRWFLGRGGRSQDGPPNLDDL